MQPITEAATIPLAAMTAAMGLYQRLSLPLPWHPTTAPTPLIIYGAASAVGSYVIQLAQLSNIHPLICIAGRGIRHVEGLIDKSKGDVILDYRDGDDKLVQSLEAVVQKHGGKMEYAFDCVSEKGSYINICKVLDHQTGQITLVLPGKEYAGIPPTITQSITRVGNVFKEDDLKPFEKKTGTKTGNEEFGYVMFRFFGRGLQEGWFKGHPYEVVPGGLGGVEGALKNLKEGKASAVKYVFRIGETEGVRREGRE
jgi:NADPH2:quinone reductase